MLKVGKVNKDKLNIKEVNFKHFDYFKNYLFFIIYSFFFFSKLFFVFQKFIFLSFLFLLWRCGSGFSNNEPLQSNTTPIIPFLILFFKNPKQNQQN